MSPPISMRRRLEDVRERGRKRCGLLHEPLALDVDARAAGVRVVGRIEAQREPQAVIAYGQGQGLTEVLVTETGDDDEEPIVVGMVAVGEVGPIGRELDQLPAQRKGARA